MLNKIIISRTLRSRSARAGISGVTAMLVWLAGLAPCRQALIDGLCERELLDAAGERHRPDLLYLGTEATVVIDFKTGQEHPDHRTQVRRYLDLTRALPGRAGLAAGGYLVYLDRRQCRPVEAASWPRRDRTRGWRRR